MKTGVSVSGLNCTPVCASELKLACVCMGTSHRSDVILVCNRNGDGITSE